MKTTIRTFIAIKIVPEDELRSFFAKAKNTFRDERIKWVDESTLHLTLRFLGETTKEQVQKITGSLEMIADQTERFSVQLKGSGYFKNRQMPSVLFVNIENAEDLKRLAKNIDKEIVKAGFEMERKVFKPHLTLGRIKFLKNIDRFKLFLSDYEYRGFQTVQVNEIIFYQSILKSEGPIYKPIGKFELK